MQIASCPRSPYRPVPKNWPNEVPTWEVRMQVPGYVFLMLAWLQKQCCHFIFLSMDLIIVPKPTVRTKLWIFLHPSTHLHSTDSRPPTQPANQPIITNRSLTHSPTQSFSDSVLCSFLPSFISSIPFNSIIFPSLPHAINAFSQMEPTPNNILPYPIQSWIGIGIVVVTYSNSLMTSPILNSKELRNFTNFMQTNFKNYLPAVASLRHIYFDDEFHVVHFFCISTLWVVARSVLHALLYCWTPLSQDEMCSPEKFA